MVRQLNILIVQLKDKLNDYAKVQGLNTSNYWWLRSPCTKVINDGPYSVCFVYNNGDIESYFGAYVSFAAMGVRPACWINLKPKM